MQAKAKPWGWGRAKAKLAGCFKKVKWGCPPSLATRGLVTAQVVYLCNLKLFKSDSFRFQNSTFLCTSNVKEN